MVRGIPSPIGSPTRGLDPSFQEVDDPLTRALRSSSRGSACATKAAPFVSAKVRLSAAPALQVFDRSWAANYATESSSRTKSYRRVVGAIQPYVCAPPLTGTPWPLPSIAAIAATIDRNSPLYSEDTFSWSPPPNSGLGAYRSRERPLSPSCPSSRFRAYLASPIAFAAPVLSWSFRLIAFSRADSLVGFEYS